MVGRFVFNCVYLSVSKLIQISKDPSDERVLFDESCGRKSVIKFSDLFEKDKNW